MNFTPDFGWYYIDANHKAPAWTGVDYLYRFLTRTENSVGPTAEEVPLHKLQPGDLVQLQLDEDPEFDHTPIIVERGEVPTLETVLVAAHSADTDYRPLSSYPFKSIRFLHVLGAWLLPQRQEPFSSF